MAVRTITITDDAYQRLAHHKLPGESFSKLIRRLVPEVTWRDLAGTLSEAAADRLADAVREGREQADRELAGRTGLGAP